MAASGAPRMGQPGWACGQSPASPVLPPWRELGMFFLAHQMQMYMCTHISVDLSRHRLIREIAIRQSSAERDRPRKLPPNGGKIRL